jgi:hypothetical protein
MIKMAELKPSEQLIAASFAVATVVAVFGHDTAPMNDVKAAPPSDQTRNDDRRAALVSAALVSGVALLAKSPGVFVIGAGAIVVESVIRAHANFTTSNTAS